MAEGRLSKLNCVMKQEPYSKLQYTSFTEHDPAAEAVDVVYTWVDARDPSFQAALHRHAGMEADLTAADLCRYRNNGELRFSLRSLLSFAPWVRRIHILTNGQVPFWLNCSHPQIHVVTHAEVFPEPEVLPTFNSNAIEMCLHRIPGLARRFIYFNDDVFLGRSIGRSDFFLLGGSQMVFLEDTLLANNCPQESARGRACAYTQAILTRLWGQPQAPRLLPAHSHPRPMTVICWLAWNLHCTMSSGGRERTASAVVMTLSSAPCMPICCSRPPKSEAGTKRRCCQNSRLNTTCWNSRTSGFG